LYTVYEYETPLADPPVQAIDIWPAVPEAVAVTVPKGLMVVIEADVALVNVEAPAVAVTVKVYELAVLSVKVKVTEVLLAADVL
jgi:hypothetical protein